MLGLSHYRKFLSNAALLTALLTSMLLSYGCQDPGEKIPTIFEPRPGTYAGDQLVSINIPTATAIYYTLDGSTPAVNCQSYAETGPITANKLTTIKVMYIENGQEKFAGEEGVFNITNGTGQNTGGGGGGALSNEQLRLDWLDYEHAILVLLNYHNNCGAQINSGGCDTGFIKGLGNLWWICDNYDPIGGTGYTDGSFNSHEGDKSGSLAQCQSGGHGWATGIVTGNGQSTYTFNNFQLTADLLADVPGLALPMFPLIGSGAMTATAGTLGMQVTGKMLGQFNISGTGINNSIAYNHISPCIEDPSDPTNTGHAMCDNAAHLKTSGSYTGYLESNLKVTTKKTTGGSFTIYCDVTLDSNCSQQPEIYAASFVNNATVWTHFDSSSVERSCSVPWFRIETQKFNAHNCLQAPAVGQSAYLQVVKCAGDEERQKWVFEDATPQDDQDAVWSIKSLADDTQCMTKWMNPALFHLNPYWVHVVDCAAGFSDADQHFSLVGFDRNINLRVNNQNFCAENFWAPVNWLNLRPCDFGGALLDVQHHAFYLEGIHPPVTAPNTVISSQQ